MRRLLTVVSGLATAAAAVWSVWWIAGQQQVVFGLVLVGVATWAVRRYRGERAKGRFWDRAEEQQ